MRFRHFPRRLLHCLPEVFIIRISLPSIAAPETQLWAETFSSPKSGADYRHPNKSTGSSSTESGKMSKQSPERLRKVEFFLVIFRFRFKHRVGKRTNIKLDSTQGKNTSMRHFGIVRDQPLARLLVEQTQNLFMAATRYKNIPKFALLIKVNVDVVAIIVSRIYIPTVLRQPSHRLSSSEKFQKKFSQTAKHQIPTLSSKFNPKLNSTHVSD